MKHLIAMIFYNIVVGDTVMFNKDYKELEKDFKKGMLSHMMKDKYEYRYYKVRSIYTTLFTKTMFKPDNLFRIGLCIENTNGIIEHVGIGACRSIEVSNSY